MGQQKALFFDIDGTLASFTDGKVTASAAQALRLAKAAGHKIIIATGRCQRLLYNLREVSDLIDGYILANGATCLAGDRVLSAYYVDPAVVAAILKDAKEKGYTLSYVTDRHFLIVNNNPSLVGRRFLETLRVEAPDFELSPEEIASEPVLQLTPFISPEYEEELRGRLLPCNSARWHPDFTDFTAPEADKGRGLKLMAGYFGLDIADTYAFGDGANDLPALNAAGTAVAMGNAYPEVKSAADYVTSDVDSDGIFLALKHFGLI